jgi:Asp-tRNA(Asn)/Glu-tRNA(Gln) amidotransferase A subunit family amidase
MDASSLTATEILEQIQTQKISLTRFVSDLLLHIANHEPLIQAWEYFDPSLVMQQAETLADPLLNPSPGVLQGIPIAIKDIFATADMPTGWGTPIHQATWQNYDAAVIERLRRAGAILLGKTVTTEYATARAGKTRNPHNLHHTPGGSSSGSAAAVAAGMAPVAIGSQTVGSILRPAAYCGILGFKPSFGSISRYGAMPVSRDLDHVGILARSIADLRLIYSVLAIADPRDPDCCGQPRTPLAPPHLPPHFALWKTPFWHQVAPETQQRFLHCAELLQNAGASVTPITLPREFEHYFEVTLRIMQVGLALNHGQDFDQYNDQLSPSIKASIEKGKQQSAIVYLQDLQTRDHYRQVLSEAFTQHDIILTPVTLSPAPASLEDTGSPILCALWTLCGLPAISIPAGQAANGLPLAIQLVAALHQDQELLQIAEWVIDIFRSSNV